jgi:hypothetical protein
MAKTRIVFVNFLRAGKPILGQRGGRCRLASVTHACASLGRSGVQMVRKNVEHRASCFWQIFTMQHCAHRDRERSDTYGHLIPSANVSFVDTLDTKQKPVEQTSPQQNATQAQLTTEPESEIPSELADLIGGGGWTRTNDLGIMRPSL